MNILPRGIHVLLVDPFIKFITSILTFSMIIENFKIIKVMVNIARDDDLLSTSKISDQRFRDDSCCLSDIGNTSGKALKENLFKSYLLDSYPSFTEKLKSKRFPYIFTVYLSPRCSD